MKCAGTLQAPSLSDVFNASLAFGMLPHNWKLADFTPLHKKGAKNDRQNYRPVSLTSVVCKVYEMIVRQQLVQFWITNDVFIPEQFGFLKRKSCLSQLLSSFHDWASARNKGLTTDVIFLDFSKAFDSLPHERLLAKMVWSKVHSCLDLEALLPIDTSALFCGDLRFVWCSPRNRPGTHFISYLY